MFEQKEITSRMFRSGYVAVAGAPNVGKSTFFNKLLGTKVSIVSEKAQTTRRSISGVLHLWPGREFVFSKQFKDRWTEGEGQIIFVDTPGLFVPFSRLKRRRLEDVQDAICEQARRGIADSDSMVLLFDAKEISISGGDPLQDMPGIEACYRKPIEIVLNKIDLIGNAERKKLIDRFAGREIHLVSSKSGEGLSVLIRAVFSKLKPGPAYYTRDMITDQRESLAYAELIREKVYRMLYQEIPYRVHVEVRSIEPSGGLLSIEAILFVEQESQKGILIGSGARTLKAIGTEARAEIERAAGRKVFLDLTVKVKSKWSRDPEQLRRFGYTE